MVLEQLNTELQRYLKSFDIFSEKEMIEILELGTMKSMSKDDHFFREGNTCNRVAFVLKGIFRHYYHIDSGEEINYCFTFPNNFVTAYSSYVTGKVTAENIQVLSDAELFVIEKEDMDALIERNRNWLKYSKIIADRQYIKRENRIFILQKEKAKNKYDALMTNNPEYLQHIPLQYLASYLGITQRHLSRLRKQPSF